MACDRSTMPWRVQHRAAEDLAGTSPLVRRVELAAFGVFPLLAVVLVLRLGSVLASPAFVFSALVTGYVAADFISGLSHWTFDTWFSPDTPFIGRAFVRPFREHHVDPVAICRHDFLETNGSNMIAGAIIVSVGHVVRSVDTRGAFVAASLLVAAVVCSAASQIHKWAHAERVPRVVALLQRARIVLPPHVHRAHHSAPFDRAYCITSGWLNDVLYRMSFFSMLERVIRATTGAVPRQDDIGLEAAALSAPTARASRHREPSSRR